MKKIFGVVILLVAVLISGSSMALAGQKQWGVETGYVKHRFIPQYSYVSGRQNSNFTDRAYGAGLSFFGRYVIPVTAKVSLPLQCSVAVNNAEWSLDTGEPAKIEYSLPYSGDISFLPTLTLAEKISVFLELGVGQGYIKEKKTSAVSSAYDFSKWTTNCVLGCGVNYTLNEQTNIFIKYRYLQYNSISYRTYLADGSQVETISDQPSTQMFNVGVLFNF